MTDDDLIPEFIEESQRSLTGIEADLLRLETGSPDDGECVNRIFRAVHSIKGAASFLQLPHIVAVSHRSESLLVAIRDGQRRPTGETIDVILKCVDTLLLMLAAEDLGGSVQYDALLKRLDDALQAGAQSHSGDGDPDESSEIVSLDQADESECSKPTHPPEQPTANQVIDDAGAARTGPDARVADPTMRVAASVLSHLLQTTGDMVMARNQLLSGNGQVDRAVLEKLSRLISEVHETVIKTRKSNTGSLFQRFTRVVRDLALQLGKEATLTIEGGELELDRAIIESFADPMTHLIRNCMDHALETPNERIAAGKPGSGHIWLRSYQQSGEIAIEIEDDGRGIDPAMIRRKAVEKGVIRPEKAAQLSDEESLLLIFAPGFSTKDETSDVSGRGVGMDVVKTCIEQIGGSISIQSVVGSGTKMTAHLPLAKALVASSLTRTLIVSIGHDWYAIPDSAVCEIVRPDESNYPKDFHALENGEVFHLRDSILPLIHLADVMGKPRLRYSVEDDQYHLDRRSTVGIPLKLQQETPLDRRKPPRLAVVMIRHRQHRLALVVNEIVGIEEAIVQPKPKLLDHCSIITGHAVLGDGRCIFILDVGGIASRSQLRLDRPADPADFDDPQSRVSVNERLLVFNCADDEYFAMPLELASLVQSVDPARIRRVGTNQFYPVRDRMVSLLYLDQYMRVRPMPDDNKPKCIIHPANVDADVAICCGVDVSVHELDGCFRSRSETDACAIGLFEWNDRLVTLIDLYKLIELHLPDIMRPAPPHVQGARILCVDDSFFFQKLIEQYLSRTGWKLTVTSTGQEAWDVLQQTPDGFDCIISDINMPEMNGFELAEKIRADHRFDDVPLVALTTQVDEQSRQYGLAIGFNRYVAKINKFALETCIDDVMKQRSRTMVTA